MKKFIPSILAITCSAAIATEPVEMKSTELADVIRQLMVSAKQTSTKDSYIEMKAIFGKLRLAESGDLAPNGMETFLKNNDYFYIFHGRINLLANSRPIAQDRMQDDASWKVWVVGPKAMVTDVWLRTNNAASSSAGPRYLRSKGLTLEPLSCSQLNASNYSAIYKVSAPGKRPILLDILSTSGSGGTWYSYHATWFSLKASDLAPEASIGLCEIDETK
jgi:hypothetical protein